MKNLTYKILCRVSSVDAASNAGDFMTHKLYEEGAQLRNLAKINHHGINRRGKHE